MKEEPTMLLITKVRPLEPTMFMKTNELSLTMRYVIDSNIVDDVVNPGEKHDFRLENKPSPLPSTSQTNRTIEA